MTTNVTVNVSVEVPITHGEEAVESFVEKLAEDIVAEALHSAGKRIGITKINAASTGLTQG